jgi:hypothetical protein
MKTTHPLEKAKLIHLNRSNNIAISISIAIAIAIAISLKAFKDYTYKRLAETIDFLDPQELIIDKRVQYLKDLLPNS